MTPPLPSPPITARCWRIPSATLASPTRVRKTGHPWCAAIASTASVVARFVTTGPFVAPEHLVRREDERQLLADRAARLVHDREAVAVHVLGEADVGPLRAHGLAERPEVLRHRLRRPREAAVGGGVDGR